MGAQPSRLSKIFGGGPAGTLISLGLLFVAFRIDGRLQTAPLVDNRILRNVVFGVSILLTIALIVWSVRSLPASERGDKLSTRGAFRYVRHPLYAAFLSIFNFGLAIYLNSYVFLLWAVVLHPVWHYVVRFEERLMVGIFGDAYLEYQRKTGRFFPRLWQRSWP